MEKISDEAIDFILLIGNTREVKKLIEPAIQQPLDLERWVVRRVVRVIELINEGRDDKTI